MSRRQLAILAVATVLANLAPAVAGYLLLKKLSVIQALLSGGCLQ